MTLPDESGRPSAPPSGEQPTTAVPDVGERAVPYVCPFCGEEDLRPEPQGRWHCRSCLRTFSVAFHGVHPVEPVPGRER